MCEQEQQGDGAHKLSNSDVIKLPDDLSLSDSDPDEPNTPFDPEVEDLSSSSADEEPQKTCGLNPGEPAFSLKGGSSNFSNRSRSIFDCLENAAKLASSQLGQDNVIDGVFARPSPRPLLPRGKKYVEKAEDLSCKPPKKTSKGVPDYLVHPERWTCYNLEDVPETSDRKNSMVAQQYIQSLQQKKDSTKAEDGPKEPFMPTFNQGNSSSSEHKIVFSRPSRVLKDDTTEGHKLDGTKKSGMGLCHLDVEEEEGAAAPHHSIERKRKWSQEVDEEGVLKDKKEQLPNIGFSINRKINRKNFRKTSGKDED